MIRIAANGLRGIGTRQAGERWDGPLETRSLRRESGEDAAKGSDGNGNAMAIVGFGLDGRPFHVHKGERADLGKDEKQNGEQVSFDSGLAAVRVPVVDSRDFGRFLFQFDDLRRSWVGWLVLAV